MTDSMKFGPEWIRTLSESGPLGLSSTSSVSHSTSSSASMSSGPHHTASSMSGMSPSAVSSMRYTLAEHRYGREEMLALYSSSLSPPESLKSLSGLYVEKSQQPLALFSFTDDEHRIWNRGVNPDGLGRGGTGKGVADTGSVRGRRDGAGREGRGRGRGGGSPGNYFPRSPGANSMSFPGEMSEPSSDINQGVPFNRNRPPFERQGERSWSERNGGTDGGGRGRTGGDTNWRRHRGDEDMPIDPSLPPNNNPGWRPQAKWQHPGRSWRDEDSWTDRDPRMSNHHLPEWAMEKNEGGGSFDASGAFHGHDLDDELPVKRRERTLHHDQKSKSESSDLGDSGGGGGSDVGSTDRMHELMDKESSHSLPSSGDGDRSDRKRDQEESSPNIGLDEIKKHVERHLKGEEQALELSEIKRQLELLERQQQQQVAKQIQVPSDPASSQIKETSSQQVPMQCPTVLDQVQTSQQGGSVSQQVNVPPPQQPSAPHPQMSAQTPVQVQMPPQTQSQTNPSPQVMLPHQPPNMQQGSVPPQVLLGSVQMSQQQQTVLQQMPPSIQPPTQPHHQPLNTLARLHQQPPQPQPILHESHMDDHSINDNIATDLVAKLMEEEEKRDKQWYYKDPQGQVQGPFSCGEMAEWFQSGYFTLGLMVKRACDPTFSPLGELIKIWGCIPFLAEQGGNAQMMLAQQAQAEKEHSPAQAQAQAQGPPQSQVNPQVQDVMLHQFKMDHFRHQQQQQHILRQQQAAAMANRNQVKMPPSEWPDHIPQQEAQQGGGQQASLQLRALLAQMQAHQQMKQQQQQTSKVKESGGGAGGGGGGGAVMETLLSLHQQQVAQQAALQQALQAAQLAEVQGGTAGSTGAASIRTLVSQMQQNAGGKIRLNNQPANIDSVWNGGNSWKQWSHVNPKTFKTEQQVLEEQMRAEDERKREEMRKQEEVVRITEEETKERKRDKQEEKVQNERNKRESEELQRRRMEEEELRRKQEAARRAEVERQRKEEDKRKKEEDKRRKEEDKRKQLEERERLKIEEERKKKEAEEAKKHQDLMNKIQRDQWCPPQASNTSLLEIQRSEREQQVLRTMQAQEAVAAAAAAAEKSNLRLKWTETSRSTPFLVESLADIQAQQYRQFMKVQEKEKAEREKKEAAAVAAASQHVGGTWSQGLNWGALPQQQPVWHNNQGGAGGFWDQLGGAKPVPSTNQPSANKAVSKGQPNSVVPAVPMQQSKENKSKAKREEMAVMQLFGSQARQDEFTKWCQQTLANLPMTCPYDIPTFVSFLREIESGPDVLEYVRGYVGESKEATEFARQFLERRLSLVQSQGAASQPVHPVGVPPSQQLSTEDFQQVKSKGKNKKKGRVTKLPVDPRILGFSSTAAPDRINVGDREYPDDL